MQPGFSALPLHLYNMTYFSRHILTRSCSQATTQLVTDLGNDDAINATDAAAHFVFNKGGSFKVCYKLKVIAHNPGRDPFESHSAFCNYT